jgi:uncharacterized 2Fe-2S/4Fe-4S cluster protein (DUF4445 family)
MTEQHLVILQPSGRRGHVDEGVSLREAARQLGVEIESICAENATCGKCKVVVEEGTFERYGITSKREHLSPPSAEETDYFRRRPKMMQANHWEVGQVRLSCQAKVLGDVLVHVPEESRGNKQIVRKSATQREIEIKPSIRKYLVEMKPPDLEQPFADWERLSRGLEVSMSLVRRGEANLPKATDLTIDYHCLRGLGDALREGDWKVTVSVWQDREVIRVQPGYVETSYGAAVDIGSTTIALYLCDLATGEILAAESEMNPQIVYGEDVMSRIQYTISEPDGLEKQHKAVIGTLNGLLKQAVRSANKRHREEGLFLRQLDCRRNDSPTRQSPVERDETVEEEIATTPSASRTAFPLGNDISTDDILEIVFVGNTTMHHLLLNIPPTHLGRAPYVPSIHKAVDIKARELGLQVNPSANVHVLPTIASFIGADTSGVLIAEEPHKQDKNWLVIDVGTNAELVLGNRHGLVCTSTPTGPALEGAHIEFGMRAAPGAIERVEIDESTLEPRTKIVGEEEWGQGKAKGICGSAIIDVVAEMVRAGILDGRGRFRRGLGSKRVREGENGAEYVVAWAAETSIGRDIFISLKDIRQIQLAKGALYVAARTLLKAAGLERPDKLILAGGFGSYIDKTKAMLIGLIPDLPLEDVYAVGNAAGDGARIALLNVDKRREAGEVARTLRRYELPTDPEFQSQFMLALNFPHMTDPFPHIAHLLPHREVDPMAKRLMGK